MKKVFFIILILLYGAITFGCNKNDNKLENINNVENNSTIADVEGDSYIVTNEDELETGLKENYSVTIKNDIITNDELIMEGDFLITYTTENHNVREVKRKLNFSYDSTNNTITSPRFIIKSNHTILKDGIYKGDMYIEARDVVLNNFKVEGNVFFKDEKSRKSFILENGSSITGDLQLE